MDKSRPPISKILVSVLFALSCFGIFLFLWVSFGGPVPLSPQGYSFNVPFDDATHLAVESDVRISGVSVGKVKDVSLGEDGLAHAEIELDSRYAPIPSDTRAILRQKTLLGETYVELSQGSNEAPALAEGGALPFAQTSKAVQLDEVFRTFDEPTRVAFQSWMQDASVALRGRGLDLSAAIAGLAPFGESANRLLRILDTQGQAVRRLVHDGGEVFTALSERQGQLRGLVQNAATLFATTATRNDDLAAAFRAFPDFLDESRLTLARLARFADLTDPLVQQLRPAAKELSPTLEATASLAPALETFFRGLSGTIKASDPGFPALRRMLDDDLPPVLTRLDPYLQQLDPLLQAAKLYRHEIPAFLANTAAATNAFNRPPEADFEIARYLRVMNPLSPEALAVYPQRLRSSRTNPYVAPQGYLDLATALQSFETSQCSGGPVAALDPTAPLDPDFNVRTGGDVSLAQDLFDRIKLFAFAGQSSTASPDYPVPPCSKQAPFESIGASPEASDYLHVRADP